MGGGLETFQVIGILIIMAVLVPGAVVATHWLINRITQDADPIIPDDAPEPEDVGVLQFFRDLLFSKDDDER